MNLKKATLFKLLKRNSNLLNSIFMSKFPLLFLTMTNSIVSETTVSSHIGVASFPFDLFLEARTETLFRQVVGTKNTIMRIPRCKVNSVRLNCTEMINKLLEHGGKIA